MKENSDSEINLSRFHECVDTWIPSEREGYRLYLNGDLQSDGPSDEYVLVKYSHRNSEGTIIAMGRVDIAPKIPVIADDVNSVLNSMDLTPLTGAQWATVSEAYSELTRRVLRDVTFEGVPQVYQNSVYHEIEEFQAAMEQYIDDIYEKIEKYEEEQENDERTHYDDYAEYGRLGKDQYYNIGRVLEKAFEWENEEKVPYAQHCQLAALLEFDSYEEWEVRAIEYLHNSVLVNKPELAKTQALLEKGLSQKEIAEKLGKSQSTVSRQVSQINEWKRRAEWMVQQDD